jgi:hypothetical protein
MPVYFNTRIIYFVLLYNSKIDLYCPFLFVTIDECHIIILYNYQWYVRLILQSNDAIYIIFPKTYICRLYAFGLSLPLPYVAV